MRGWVGRLWALLQLLLLACVVRAGRRAGDISFPRLLLVQTLLQFDARSKPICLLECKDWGSDMSHVTVSPLRPYPPMPGIHGTVARGGGGCQGVLGEE